jgi:hypothetical protein
MEGSGRHHLESLRVVSQRADVFEQALCYDWAMMGRLNKHSAEASGAAF